MFSPINLNQTDYCSNLVNAILKNQKETNSKPSIFILINI